MELFWCRLTSLQISLIAAVVCLLLGTAIAHAAQHQHPHNPSFFAVSKPEWHPCFRECSTNPSTFKTCGYNFTVEYYWTLSKACYECPNKTLDCSRTDCVPGDGVRRGIAVVNRMMPGPAIRVCEGDTVVVDVSNQLNGESTAIHWHGILQRKTPWMDGVPGLTQCPIPPASTFRYEFEVPDGGTHFWHSHAGFQRGDGLFGPLIVRKPNETDVHKRLYDYDLPEHELVIWDWLADLSLPVFLKHHHSNGDNKPRGILVNGRGFPGGFFDDIDNQTMLKDSEKPFVPLHEVRVKQGSTYRMRIISNGVLNCPLEMSIEKHSMQIIASDGSDLEPVTVQSLVIYAGERWDIVIRANQAMDSYWIKFRGLMDCDDRFTSAFQVAVLNYEGMPAGSLPITSVRNWHEAAAHHGMQLNPLNIAPSAGTGMGMGMGSRYMTIADLSSVNDDDPDISMKPKADYQFYLSYDFNPIDNLHFHGPHIPLRTVAKGLKLYTPQINFISNVMPSAPLLTQPETLNHLKICNSSSLSANCTEEFCECTHLLKVRLNSIVELVLVDRGITFNANHPFHLHGASFRIMAMERLGDSTEPWVIKDRDEKGLIRRKRFHAPIKDSVTVPDGGYTILRFRANNPGFWFFHCHITFHVEVGMGLTFQVGETSEMPRAPSNFPKCGDYIPDVKIPPVFYEKRPQLIVPLQNNTNPHFPPYDMANGGETGGQGHKTTKPPKKNGAPSTRASLAAGIGHGLLVLAVGVGVLNARGSIFSF